MSKKQKRVIWPFVLILIIAAAVTGVVIYMRNAGLQDTVETVSSDPEVRAQNEKYWTMIEKLTAK